MRGSEGDIEQRTSVSIAVAVALGSQFLAPTGYRLQPEWLLPSVCVSLALLITVGGRRVEDPGHWSLRVLALTLGGALALGNLGSVVMLVHGLVKGQSIHASSLLQAGAAAWVTNVVAFAVLLWEVDAGGPVARARTDFRGRADLVFPQYSLGTHSTWTPRFVDYAYVAFTNATAFSPTDSLPLRARMKVLMAVQSSVALVAVAVVFARAANILGT